MDLKALFERLGSFGLEASEARLYYHISRIGPARAAEIGEAADVNRTEVYRLADGLVQKGFLEKTLERPTRFVPVSLETVLEKRMGEYRETIDDMDKRRQNLLADWPRFQTNLGTQSQRFTVFQGSTQIRGLLDRMITGAKEEIAVAASMRGMSKMHIPTLFQGMSDRANGGVVVRLLTNIDVANVSELRDIASNCEVRHVELSGYHQMIVVDSKEIAIFVSSGRTRSTSGNEETVLWLNAPDFVLAQKALFDGVWETGVNHRERDRSLKDERLPYAIQTIRGRWVRLSKLKEILYRSKDLVLHATKRELDAWRRAGVLQIIEKRLAAGCRIRIFLEAGAKLDGGIPWETMRTPLPFPMAVTKEGESLVVHEEDMDEDGNPTEEWTVWSTIPAQATYLLHWLEESGQKGATRVAV